MNKSDLADAVMEAGNAKGKTTSKVKVLPSGEYICNGTPECEYVRAKQSSVVSHLAAHTPRTKTPKNRKQAHAVADSMRLAAAKLIENADKIEELEEAAFKKGRPFTSENEWRERAQTAERKLGQLRKALGL